MKGFGSLRDGVGLPFVGFGLEGAFAKSADVSPVVGALAALTATGTLKSPARTSGLIAPVKAFGLRLDTVEFPSSYEFGCE